MKEKIKKIVNDLDLFKVLVSTILGALTFFFLLLFKYSAIEHIAVAVATCFAAIPLIYAVYQAKFNRILNYLIIISIVVIVSRGLGIQSYQLAVYSLCFYFLNESIEIIKEIRKVEA